VIARPPPRFVFAGSAAGIQPDLICSVWGFLLKNFIDREEEAGV
jgi:hypothetical protein